ncbi:MAG TPA: SIS domain-containing protein [Kofleriaceae bacterium]|nr:SIS domain-containing protein [Kofleriaceae bacterium]
MSTFAREAAEAAAGARAQIATCGPLFVELAARLAARPPPVIITCARGSSDHAASYGKYVLETTLRRVVASIGPSVARSGGASATATHRLEGVAGALVLVVSQSGESPDLLHTADVARASDAFVVGLINAPSSPLAASCDLVIPLCAGPETSVAATKTFLLASLAFLQLAAAWSDAPSLHDAVDRLPDALDAARALDWSSALAPLVPASTAYILGRGVSLGSAQEIALKLKETCRLHAEPFSTAELHHGPLALVEPGFPILALGQDDTTAATSRATIGKLVSLGARVATTLDVEGTTLLPTVPDVPAIAAPLCAVASFYAALPSLCTVRGTDLDAPRHLTKVTRTR